MSKQHEKVKALRQYNRWRRGATHLLRSLMPILPNTPSPT
jgi:hypothetical protein